jgi:hypothetical protein
VRRMQLRARLLVRLARRDVLGCSGTISEQRGGGLRRRCGGRMRLVRRDVPGWSGRRSEQFGGWLLPSLGRRGCRTDNKLSLPLGAWRSVRALHVGLRGRARDRACRDGNRRSIHRIFAGAHATHDYTASCEERRWLWDTRAAPVTSARLPAQLVSRSSEGSDCSESACRRWAGRGPPSPGPSWRRRPSAGIVLLNMVCRVLLLYCNCRAAR